MLDDSFNLNFSDSESTKKLFNTTNDSIPKHKNKEKNKNDNDSYSQNSSNYSQTSQKSQSHNQKFSHVFITIYKFEKLFKCQMQTLFARIRFHPKISIIQTNNSMCISNILELNCSYALDFRSIPPFGYQDFTPVVELYRRIPKHSELIGVSLLPLKEIEHIKIQKKNLTYFYHNSRVPVKDIMTGSMVGTLVISIAFGFQEHQSLFDPNIYSTQNQQNIKINPTNNQIEIENDENDNEEDSNRSEVVENKKNRNHRHHHHHHRHKKKTNQWQKVAAAAGWKPPDFVSSEWKTKAIKRGWIPPEKQLKSSIAINCKKDDIVTKESISTQYDPVLLAEIDNKNHTNSSTFSEENQNQSDDELEDIINILNPKSNKKRKRKNNLESDSSQLILTSPSTIFQKEFPKLCLTPVMQLLTVDAESDQILSESSDDSDILLNNNVNDIINNVLNCQKNSTIKKTASITSSDDDTNHYISIKKKKINSEVYEVSSEIFNDKESSETESSSTSSSAANVKKCLGRMDDDVKKILDIYGIENDFF